MLKNYDGKIPFAPFIKDFFSQYKKFGSKDRKQISRLCYSYFRLGKSCLDLSIENRVLLGLKFANQSQSEVSSFTLPKSKVETASPSINGGLKNEVEREWLEIINKADFSSFDKPANVFPWKSKLSETIDATAFEASFFVQPDLFLRIRPDFVKTVPQKFKSAGIEFYIENNTVSLKNTTKVANFLHLNKEAVIQDFSSQKIAHFLDLIKSEILNQKSQIYVWDCCAASGGKSILAKDVLNNISLTVSDIRPSIIANLKKRFREAGIGNYSSVVADLTKNNNNFKQDHFDLVIADVPCTGSGTWSRTPEQLFYFEDKKIEEYASLQRKILENISTGVKKGGFLLYITCSVFQKENEQQALFITQKGFEVLRQEVIPGYTVRADTMFAALLRKK
ncbi:MAG: methyltransferase domain-containing protein [Sphingobacteriales bacterium]|nr:methyltransferase domain-containing protein [Sphingobacteriales bacterium]